MKALLFALAFLSTAAFAQERAVLVTGASSGIGLRMTEVLSQNGFHVYAGARKDEDLARLDAMDNVTSIRLDVTVQEEIDAAVERIRAEGRGLYGLVNNAGVVVVGPMIELPESELDYLFDVNLYGPYRVTKAFAPLIIESRGRILTTTSIAGTISGAFIGVYSMSKHGLEAYIDALAPELTSFGVAVAAVEPGNFKSRITLNMRDHMRKAGITDEGSRYGPWTGALFAGSGDRSEYQEPDAVAAAALEFLTTDSPRRRYMVTPNQQEAEMTIRAALGRAVQLNAGHEFSFERDDLVRMLDEVLAGSQ